MNKPLESGQEIQHNGNTYIVDCVGKRGDSKYWMVGAYKPNGSRLYWGWCDDEGNTLGKFTRG